MIQIENYQSSWPYEFKISFVIKTISIYFNLFKFTVYIAFLLVLALSKCLIYSEQLIDVYQRVEHSLP